MLPTLIIIASMVATYYTAMRKGINLFGEAILGSIIGVIWELSLEPDFNYNTDVFTLFIYKDVPLAVVLAWGFVMMVASVLADELYKIVKNKFVSITLAAWSCGLAGEMFGLAIGAWKYEVPFPVRVLVGWFVFGGFFLWFVKSFDRYIERVVVF